MIVRHESSMIQWIYMMCADCTRIAYRSRHPGMKQIVQSWLIVINHDILALSFMMHRLIHDTTDASVTSCGSHHSHWIAQIVQIMSSMVYTNLRDHNAFHNGWDCNMQISCYALRWLQASHRLHYAALTTSCPWKLIIMHSSHQSLPGIYLSDGRTRRWLNKSKLTGCVYCCGLHHILKKKQPYTIIGTRLQVWLHKCRENRNMALKKDSIGHTWLRNTL